MFTESFFNILLNLDEDWVVEKVATDIKLGEVVIEIKCLLKEVEDIETCDLCAVHVHAPERKWRHLDTLQYKTFICCSLPRIRTSSGKVKTVSPPWTSGYAGT